MRTMTPQDVKSVAEESISTKKKMAMLRREPFIGVTRDEFIENIDKHGEWIIQEAPPVQLTPEDINAVANARFLRKTGITLILVILVIALALGLLTTRTHLITPMVYYALIILFGLAFAFTYGKKQKEVRDELWQHFEKLGYKRNK